LRLSLISKLTLLLVFLPQRSFFSSSTFVLLALSNTILHYLLQLDSGFQASCVDLCADHAAVEIVGSGCQLHKVGALVLSCVHFTAGTIGIVLSSQENGNSGMVVVQLRLV
jgi:hypothetical protein